MWAEHNELNVLVLIAVKNGLAYLPEQLRSILNQRNCHVSILISDDQSIDGSLEYLQDQARANDKIKILPGKPAFGSAAKNFFHLILSAETENYDYIAFSDQDDIWLPEKLARHCQLALSHHAEGVSSNVIAFWPDGRKRLINKAQAQREFDYLFESAGPGCTFLMSPWLINRVKAVLLDAGSPAKEVALHDWLVYAVCRASGGSWFIDNQPSVNYRQHFNNVVGANVGIGAFFRRLIWLRQHWYRTEVSKIILVCYQISGNIYLRQIMACINNNHLTAKVQLIRRVSKLRRKVLDRVLLIGAVLCGLF